jgi:phosphonopyruvate decarboxylase
MIDCAFFYKELTKRGIEFWTGVPDSLLKDFCAFLSDNFCDDKHIIAVNEGAAIALAAGHYLARGKPALVYMQNSGIGNAVNPLLSLISNEVYGIPLLLLIGWRGEPGFHDEPQHSTQGRLTLSLLDALEIPYCVLSQNEEDAQLQIDLAVSEIERTHGAYALVVRKGTFAANSGKGLANKENAIPLYKNVPSLTREEVIEAVTSAAREGEVFFSTTGMASRELWELREKHGEGHGRDFLVVGSMGHASSIALGFALARQDVSVCCLDGDGAALMHLGTIASIGAIGSRFLKHFRHIVLNNGAHDSVGGQPTIAPLISLAGIAVASGYASVRVVASKEELNAALLECKEGPAFIEVLVKKGARPDLSRPTVSAEENKKAFMQGVNP